MLSLEPLSDSIVNEAAKRHSQWRNGYAQLWKGWQFNISEYNCTGYRFCNYSLQEMVGSYAVMNSCNFYNCDLSYSRMNSAIANHSEYHSCMLKEAYLPCVRMDGAVFENCEIYHADFRMAKMNNVVMKNCDLTGCDFQDAELAGADLRFCTVTGCNFKGTELDFSNRIPPYCYCKDVYGKTIMIMTGYKDVYDVPEFMQIADPMELNAAHGVSLDRVNQMIACFNKGWLGIKPQMKQEPQEPQKTRTR